MAKNKKEAIKEIQESTIILDKMFSDKAIDPLLYYRAIIRLAADYSGMEMFDSAMAMLLKVPESYYKQHMAEDMRESEEFHKICDSMLHKLVMAGYNVISLKVNMPSASA